MNQSPQIPPHAPIPQSGPDTAQCEWLNTADGTKHFVRCWSGAIGAPVCIYLHGIEGHSRWFEETALALRKEGITVYAADRRGAGASHEPRGHISSYRRLVKDLDELIAQISQRHPSSQLFIIANCWGAKIAIQALSRPEHFYPVAGLVLTSPAVAVKVDVDLITKLKIGLSYLSGGKKYFDIPLTAEHFTDTAVYLDYIEQDPLRLKQATASFLVESLKLTSACITAARKLSIPLLVLQSGRDEIVKVDGIKAWFETVSSQDKTLQIFPNATHSLDFDPIAPEYQKVLTGWISDHSGGRPT